uniref:RNA-directed DNA polymerase, eukaryota n=1 Tax=Tanacetum cinerariifolium TaxID=118510 RepID=A0A6L2LCZ7_TANCI|nr:RNA-directed DNA polymerase, eukaryota [Tanacetum cinerariifolium]
MESELGNIDKELDAGFIFDSHLARRLELKGLIHGIKAKEVADRVQKSKVRWAIEGDENSKFFHGIINEKRSQLAIRGIFVDGSWQTEPKVIKEAFLTHYEACFKKPISNGPKINYLFPNRLSHDQMLDLERVVSRDEIRSAVWNCGDNKSPGPDGYTFEFFKRYWRFIGNDFCEAVEQVVQAGMFKGIQINNSISLSHLFYADDALIIGEWSRDNLKGIINVLNCFFLASGLRINMHKSQLLGLGVPRSDIEAAAHSIGCSIMDNQFRYLSVMVGGNSTRHKFWADVVSKVKSHLSKWKTKTLSIGGRFTLLKSDKVLASKKKGGLGVSSYFALNRALLLKWIWRFVYQDESLWFQVMQAIHGPNIASHSDHLNSNWCSILRELKSLKDKGFDFLSLCSKRLGDGTKTSFWLDIWKGDIKLCDKFPRIYGLELDKTITVAAKMNFVMDSSFRRPVRRGLEAAQFNDLRSFTNDIILSNSIDRWICNIFGDVIFRVKDIRNRLDDLMLPSGVEATKWVKFVPIKINIFGWRARRDCLPTRANLIRRGVHLESATCSICDLYVEDTHHIMFQCSLAQSVFRRICRWWELDWQNWSSFSNWDERFSSIRLDPNNKKLLEGVFYVACWSIWAFRNRLLFGDKAPASQKLGH